jgi:lipoprotein-releasing system permease protein
MLGIALGVAGTHHCVGRCDERLSKEVRDRMLGVISHIEVFCPTVALASHKTLAEIHASERDGCGYFMPDAAGRGEDMKNTLVRSIDPALEGQVTDLAAASSNTLARLVPGNFGAGR